MPKHSVVQLRRVFLSALPFVLLAGAAAPLAAAERWPAGEAAVAGPAEGLGDCLADAQTLCLSQGRFEVRAIWRDFAGASNAGIAHSITPNSGYFHFFSPNNVEVLVKVLDGCDPRLGSRFWFFAGGLTDVQVELRVKDTLTGKFRLYTNRIGTTFDPILDTDAFDSCDAAASAFGAPAFGADSLTAEPQTAAPTALVATPVAAKFDCEPYPLAGNCLSGRFGAKVTYRSPVGDVGEAEGLRLTADTAAFHFYDANNYEVVVKVLDACAEENPAYWVFAAGLTDLEADLEIVDRATGRTQLYQRGPGPFAPILDLGSFPCDQD